MSFRTMLVLSGKTATGLEVPGDVVTALGKGKRPPVMATINGYRYRTTVAPMGGSYWIPVSAQIREAAGIAAGQEVDVELAIDEEPRELAVPDDLAHALEADSGAREFFERLSYSNKRRIVEPILGAKTPETRQRRIERAVEKLRSGEI